MDTALATLVNETKLKGAKADALLMKFEGFEAVARKWEAEAKGIVVTSEIQVADMERAREGRLILRDKRISIENTRKTLKEESLREGQAIDKIAKHLKGLIEPIETYLEEQERFVELKQAREAAEAAEKVRIEREATEAKAKAEREAAEAAERERLRKENEELRRKQQEAEVLAAETKRNNEETIRIEKFKLESAEKARIKAVKEAAAARERVRVVQTKKNEQLAEVRRENAELKKKITCPACGHNFNL